MNRKSLNLVVAVLVTIVVAWQAMESGTFSGNPTPRTGDTSEVLKTAFESRQSDLQVLGEGRVTRILSDDLDGSRHQRFILDVGHGQTVLISHNIDLAPRISGLSVGDNVEFFGEYEWNDRGGVIHWTHHDPGGRHVDGWLRHRGVTYQ